MKKNKKRTKAVYRWIIHSDDDTGVWKLTKGQEDFLDYLQNNGFLHPDLEHYFLHEEEVDE